MKFIFNLILLAVLAIGGTYLYATLSGDDELRRKLDEYIAKYSEQAREMYDNARENTDNAEENLKREAGKVERQIKNFKPPKL